MGGSRRQVLEREGRGGAAGGDAEKMGEEERLLSPARRKHYCLAEGKRESRELLRYVPRVVVAGVVLAVAQIDTLRSVVAALALLLPGGEQLLHEVEHDAEVLLLAQCRGWRVSLSRMHRLEIPKSEAESRQ